VRTWAGMGVLVCAAACLSACTAIKSEPQAASHSVAEAEILARTKQFSQAIVEASGSGWSPPSVARIADFYADDTVVFPPRGEPMRGRAALGTYWSRPAERRMLAHSAVAERVDVSGDLATEWGTLATTTQQDGAKPVEGKATYISIWTRRNGVWRKQMDTWW
jgi:ketosteroid isomerase-like protein